MSLYLLLLFQIVGSPQNQKALKMLGAGENDLDVRDNLCFERTLCAFLLVHGVHVWVTICVLDFRGVCLSRVFEGNVDGFALT